MSERLGHATASFTLARLRMGGAGMQAEAAATFSRLETDHDEESGRAADQCNFLAASTACARALSITGGMKSGSLSTIEAPAEVSLSPCPSCGEQGRWACVQANGQAANILFESTPHRLGTYALLRDGRRAVNLVWASEVEPGVNWLEWRGQRHRDHFTVCSGWRGLRTGSAVATAAVEMIAADLEPVRPTRQRSRRLRDWL